MSKLGYWKYQARLSARRMALERGWTGHTDYTRFILLGRSRVGSNFLRGLLNAHSQAVVLGELFQNRQAIGWAMEGFPGDGRTLAQFLHRPVTFLQDKVWRHYPETVRAVGFKIFYYHARDPEWTAVWDALGRDKDLRVLHLKRRNLLEIHLSRQRALLSDQWVHTEAGQRQAVGAIELDYAACLADFEQTRAWEEAGDAFFAGHPRLTLTYEELAAETEAEMRRVFTFLGLPLAPAQAQTAKQRQRPLAEAIANFDELKTKFAGTPWAEFFEQ